MTISTDFFKTIAGLRKQGCVDEGLARLREVLRRGQLDHEETERAGRIIRNEIQAKKDAGSKPLRVLLAGQCTTSWLVPALTAVAWAQDVPCLVTEGGYDNILQDLSTHVVGDEAPDVVVLLPWNQRLFGGSGTASDRIGDEMAYWRSVWDLVKGRLASRVLQVGYDWVVPGADGHGMAGRAGGRVDLARRMNAALREQLPPDAFFLDLDQVSGIVGRNHFYDMRRYHWTKQPFSESGTCHFAEHLWAGVRALTTGPKKVLVLDLDNTLWGGVVGETGPLGIGLGESPDGEGFRAFQQHCKDLSKRGILLALASKNNLADAREPFEKNPDMILSLDDFAAAEICWDPKGTTIRRLAETLNLGLDSFVFFDDNPAEREQVRQALPEVAVVDVPEEPAEYVRALQSGLWFEATGLTDADLVRSEQYAQDRKRRELQGSHASMEDYLRSLEMRGDVRPIDESDMQRVVQMLAKTNQFNLTSRRHTRADVIGLMASPRAIPMTLRVADKFGDHGLVALMIGVPDEELEDETVRIDTWLMSCRVIGRTVEHFFFGAFLERARLLGYRRVIGEFLPTKKNALVSGLYTALGFRPSDPSQGLAGAYVLDIEQATAPATFVVDVADATTLDGSFCMEA